ncbi:hypothetical protein [Ralstonia sp. 24A2]|uniref:hypothetical protein n=1 Tax=Ralstonia sp. 24A2 TaxID=3447364 RepID=UPI003F696D9C
MAANELLGAGGERLEIFFGDQIQRIWGNINQTATTNKTLRIYSGKELQQRFRALSEGTRMLCRGAVADLNQAAGYWSQLARVRLIVSK